MQHGYNTCHTLLPPMPAYIRSRATGSGKRFDVIYRRGGRYSKVEHGGTFKTKREAEARKRTIDTWLAEAKDPRVELARFLDPGATMREAGEAWLRARRSIGDRTREEYERRVERIGRDIAVDVDRLTWQDVNEWIDRLDLAPSTVAEYVTTLRAILDHAGVDPNPARDRRVELPRRERKVIEPPDAQQTLRVLAHATTRFRPVLVLIEQTGMRVSEACAVRPEHIDSDRVLVPTSKTGRPRWAPLPLWLADVLEPPWSVNRQTVHNALKAACRDAGGKPFGPHMLRHRRASLWSGQHVPPAEAAARLGHTVETYLRTYTHVVPVEEIPAHRLEALLR